MLRLLKLTIALTVILSALIVLARVVAPPDVYAFPLNSINLTADCQLPCWHGITPGVTTRAEVLAIFDADPAYLFSETESDGNLQYDYKTPFPYTGATVDFDDKGIVEKVDLTGYDTLYHVVAKQKRSFKVVNTIDCTGPRIYFYSPGQTAINVLAPFHMLSTSAFNTSANLIVMYEITSKTLDLAALTDPVTPWHGFRSRYDFPPRTNYDACE